MENSRITKSLRGIVFGFANKILTIIFPFVIRTVLIKTLGPEYAGLSNLFASIIGALSLSELGFGGIIVYFLYKPLSENNIYLISGIINYYKKIYRSVGLFIFCAGVFILPFITYFIKGHYPNDINIYIIYMVLLLNTVISYFLFSYKAALLTASHRQDVASIIASIVCFMSFIFQLSSLYFFKNYYLYIIISPLMTILLNIISSRSVNKLFPYLDEKARIPDNIRREIKRKVIDAIGFRIDTAVLSSSDSIVISSFLGLVILTQYNNYLYIITSLFGIINIIIQSIKPGIANSIILETVEKNEKNMHQITFMFSWIMGWCSTCLICLYQDFMVLWIGKEYLLPMYTVLLLVFYFYECKMIEAINMYKDSLGFWSEDKIRPYFESGFNLVTNLIFVNLIGLNGVVVSTILANLIFAYPSIIYVMYKKYFIGSPFAYVGLLCRYSLNNIFVAVAMYFICECINLPTLLSFIVKGLLCLLIPNIIYYILYKNKREFAYFNKMIGYGFKIN